MTKGKAALLVIDVQHDFIDDGAPVHCVGGKDMLPKIKQLIEACRGADIPVIYTQEVHRASHVDMGRELDGNEPDPCIIGSKGVEIMEEIAPDDKWSGSRAAYIYNLNDCYCPYPRRIIYDFAGAFFPLIC